MRTMDLGERTRRRFNLVPALCTAAVVAFLAFAGLDFLHSWPAAAHGMLIFERTCPIRTS